MDEVERTESETTLRNNDGSVTRQRVATTSGNVSGSTVAVRTIWWIVGAICALIALRFVLLLLGANKGNGFVDLVYSLSNFFVSPFNNLFSVDTTYGVSKFDLASIVAVLVYSLVGFGITKLLTISKAER